jgi:DNA-binding protein H-NS
VIKTSDMRKMDYADLVKLRDELNSIIAEQFAAQKAKFRDDMEAKAKLLGFNLDELLGEGATKHRGSRAGSTARIKYRDNNGNTWSGRGLMPKWMKEATANGKTKDDFLV